MKKHLSVFGIFARSSIYKVLGVLALMFGIEFTLFALKLSRDTAEILSRLEIYIDLSKISVCFAVAFVLITVIICLPGTEYRSKVGYTLRRLSVSERDVFFHQAAFGCIAYLMLWAAQAAVIFVISFYYCNTVPEELISNQSVFLASYRSVFLHSVLPLSDIALWIRNFLLVIALGLASAEFSFAQRRKKNISLIIPLAIYVLIFFNYSIGNLTNCFFTVIFCIIAIGKMLYDVLHSQSIQI